jgi:hypothetical protein
MLAAGVALIVVSRQLGHANPQITASVYAHLLGDSELDRAAWVFDTPQRIGTMRETMRGETPNAGMPGRNGVLHLKPFGLMTRRSQVRILPPLPLKGPLARALRRFRGRSSEVPRWRTTCCAARGPVPPIRRASGREPQADSVGGRPSAGAPAGG